jgi:hypothetical protein
MAIYCFIEFWVQKFDIQKTNKRNDSSLLFTGTNMKSGGIPPVIFQLENLQELYLNNQGIQMIPTDIENLRNLRVLSLTHCLMLQSIPASIGLLPNIKGTAFWEKYFRFPQMQLKRNHIKK